MAADGKGSIRCPDCKAQDNFVVDSRVKSNGENIRRRRECAVCGIRFTTREVAAEHISKIEGFAVEAINEIKAVIDRLNEKINDLSKDVFD